MSNDEKTSLEDIEAENELFGEVIEQSDAQIESVNVMSRSDLSESSSAHGSSISLPNRKSNHAGVADGDRASVSSAPERSNSGLGLTIGLIVLICGGLFLLTMGNEEEAKPTEAETSEATTTVEKKPEIKADSDEGRGDGTPTLDVATLTRGMVAAGWRVGDPSVTTIDEVEQTNLLVTKDEMAASVAIYESKKWDWSNRLLLETEPPAQGLSFGRTIVRISPGPTDRMSGVLDLYTAMSDFKKAARAKATGESPEGDSKEAQPAE